MGAGVMRAALLLTLLALVGWSSQSQGQTTSSTTPAAALAAVVTDDGGDWLPALVPALLLPAAFVVLRTVARVALPQPTACVRIRTTRSRGPPAR